MRSTVRTSGCSRVLLVVAFAAIGPRALPAAEPAELKYDTYSGYFVLNKFEPNAAESFVVASSQEQFDNVFGAAFVMHDKSHRLAKGAFESSIVVAAIKRGNALWDFKVDSVVVADGVVQLKYTAKSQPNQTASFAVPLIVSIPKGDYKAVEFIENGKSAKRLETGKE